MQNPFAGMATLEADTNKQSQPEDESASKRLAGFCEGVRSSGDKYWAEGEESELNTEYTLFTLQLFHIYFNLVSGESPQHSLIVSCRLLRS